MCYLSASEDCGGRDGLRLYRHRPSGAVTGAGASPDQLAVFRRDAQDECLWEVAATVPMAFNRMVLFDGLYFHGASEGFGHDAATGRLTQLFAIDFVV